MAEQYKPVVGGNRKRLQLKLVALIAAAVVLAAAVAAGTYAILHASHKKPAANSASQAHKTPPKNGGKSTATGSVNNAVINTHDYAALGQYLTDPKGATLYTYSKDTSSVSNCTGDCLTSWPAYTTTGATTNLPAGVSVITRTDNKQVQYAYKGKPLYYFAGDGSGQVTGDGVNDFHVAKP